MKFTVLGSSGFIGSHLASYLKEQGFECFTPMRNDQSIFEENLGHVIYSIGLTADFRKRPFDTVRAHVCHLLEILEKTRFESLLYLSSARIYSGATAGSEETVLKVDPKSSNDLYNLSKLMGESLCLSSGLPSVRIARLSNVYGYDPLSPNFLNTIIRDAVERKEIVLATRLSSEKDFIGIDDVTRILPQIAVSGKYRLYNIASGINISNSMLIDHLIQLTGCSVKVLDNAPDISFPKINIVRISSEFGFKPSSVLNSLGDLAARYKRR